MIETTILGKAREVLSLQADGSAMSRLDRFLLSDEWIQEWGVVAQWALNRDVSDHCPIVLKDGCQNWGPKPFRFFNCRLDHQGFKKLVESAWLNFSFFGWKAFVLKEKLKSLKSILKNWNSQVFGNVENNLKKLEMEISSLDSRAELVGLSEEEVILRRSKFVELWGALKAKQSILRQKSRVQWPREGDSNSSFFHACLAIRRRRNQLVAVLVDDVWVEDVCQIKNEVINHFSRIYSEDKVVRPRLDGVNFQILDLESKEHLVRNFSMEKAEEIVHSFDGNKCLGPDGYNFKFLQSFWHLVKEDVWGMVNEFFEYGKLPSSFSSYFVALVPKIKNPHKLSEY